MLVCEVRMVYKFSEGGFRCETFRFPCREGQLEEAVKTAMNLMYLAYGSKNGTCSVQYAYERRL